MIITVHFILSSQGSSRISLKLDTTSSTLPASCLTTPASDPSGQDPSIKLPLPKDRDSSVPSNNSPQPLPHIPLRRTHDSPSVGVQWSCVLLASISAATPGEPSNRSFVGESKIPRSFVGNLYCYQCLNKTSHASTSIVSSPSKAGPGCSTGTPLPRPASNSLLISGAIFSWPWFRRRSSRASR